MAQNRKINLLVIPDLFPKFTGDVQGIFVLDYLKSVEAYCNCTVLFVRLTGQKKGLVIEKSGNTAIYRYSFSERKIPAFFKPLYYILWFFKGYSLGKEFKDTDIIHSHGTILGGTLSYFLAKKLKKPFVITEHQGPFSIISASFWKRNWAKFSMEKADKMLVVSNHLKNEILESGIRPKNMEVTYNPVDTKLFTLKENVLRKNILYVGRLDAFKGALVSVQAFEQISPFFSEWKFTIVGDGEHYTTIKTYLNQHSSLNGKVFLEGKKSKAEIAEQMKLADFLVFPSMHESFGLVVAEALSSGLPVITTNLTAPKEFVHENSGILVPPDDQQAIATAMQKMISSLGSYNSQAIRQDIVDNFGFENFGKKLLKIYQSLLNKA